MAIFVQELSFFVWLFVVNSFGLQLSTFFITQQVLFVRWLLPVPIVPCSTDLKTTSPLQPQRGKWN